MRDSANNSGVPAIAYVILLLILLNWSLAIAAFFLDRYPGAPLAVADRVCCQQ